MKDRRGAVYVEFLAVFMPLLTAFLCLAQGVGMFSAKLITKHAAVLGARAAVVVIPDDKQYYDGVDKGQATGKKLDDIKKAVLIGLGANKSISLALTMNQIIVGGDSKAAKSNFSRNETVTVYVDSVYRCSLPIGKYAVCGFDTLATLQSKASLRIHGADYDYP
ncbi:MAG: hypothetical protein R3B13_07800 [Polyangiaceae bacterium]